MKRRATVICEQDGKILLVAKTQGRWSFPGGRVKVGEALDDAAVRELHEETCLTAETIRYAFQFHGLRTRHYVHVATVDPSAVPTPANEIAVCRWFRLKELRTLEASIPTKGIAEIFLKQSRSSGGTTLKESLKAFVS